MKCTLPGGPSLVDAHFAGSISPARERELRSHLPTCASCRDHYERYLLISALDPQAKRPQERLATGLGMVEPRRPAGAAPIAVILCAAAAIALAVVPLRNRRVDEFASRGVSTSVRDPKLLVYRIEHGQLPQTLGTAMHAADELAFAYANPGGYHRLMIFGVDEHRHVYWYHPEWSNAADDPHGIEVASDANVHEIPAAVRHSFDGTDLTILAVFSNEDLSVRRVEAMVQRAKSLDDSLPIPNAAVKKFHVAVGR